MRIIFIQLVVPIVCYFIGVAVGRKTARTEVEIQHVGYTSEQMEYDK